jgi:succinylglutamate desuccinylase
MFHSYTDFLELTRANEWHLDAYEIPHGNYDVQVWDTGVIQISPKGSAQKATSVFVYSCAIHGNETAPIEICNELINEFLQNKTTITQPVLFIFGNPASINIGERFVEENMNRLFSGHHSTPNEPFRNKECERAAKLEAYVTRFFESYPKAQRTHYDLHTAIRDSAHEKFAVYPYLHEKPWHKHQFETLKAMGVSTFLLMEKPATTFSYYSSNTHGAFSFTIELGKVRPFGDNDQSKFAAAKQTLADLLKGNEFAADAFDDQNYQLMTVYREINKHDDSFELCFADDLANFTQFKKGDVIAKEAGKDIVVEQDGEAIVFPNAHVAIGQRALLMVLPTNINHKLVD